MKPTTNVVSYLLFLKELENLLQEIGVSYSREQIFAGVEEKENRGRRSSTKDETPQVGRVILYMEEHLTDDISLEELADEVGLSKYQLIRRFSSEKGITPWKFLIQKRIKKAQKLLEQGIPPGQVAVETGFYDQSHLNKIFREEAGQTPKEYQEEHFRNRN